MADMNLGHTQAILKECKAYGLTIPQTAYVLATAWHETGGKMVPVEENLRYSSAERIKAVWPTRFGTAADAKPFVNNPQKLANKVYGGRIGNTAPDDGWRYRGRGYPQTTGKDNYATASRLMGVDAVAYPDLLLDPAIAARAMVVSMRDGLYTGKSLGDYINQHGTNYVAARRVVNGTDRAHDIALKAKDYGSTLQLSNPTRELQGLLGVTADSIWGPRSQAALDAFTAKANRIELLAKEMEK